MICTHLTHLLQRPRYSMMRYTRNLKQSDFSYLYFKIFQLIKQWNYKSRFHITLFKKIIVEMLLRRCGFIGIKIYRHSINL